MNNCDIDSLEFDDPVPSNSITFKEGDLFKLSTINNNNFAVGTYKYLGNNKMFNLEYYYDGEWETDHFWNLSTSISFVKMAKKTKILKYDGCFCVKCKNYCQFSEPNQKDGTFKCYTCRN